MSDKDTIYRQVAIDALFELYEYQRDIDPTETADLIRQGIYLAEKKIEQLPSAQPKRGKWIERESDTEDKEYGFETVIVCSCCGYPATTFYSEDCESRTQIRTAFCPTCGADMRGNEDGTD